MTPWNERTLISLADYINGYAFKPSDHKEGGLPIIRIEQLKDADAKCDYYEGDLPDNILIDTGDLIFSWSASLFLKIWDRGKAALNQHLFKVIPYEEIDKHFLRYIIDFNLEGLSGAAHGSTMKHITRKELAKYKVFIPVSRNEQSAIAKVLSKLDQAIEQTERLIAKCCLIMMGLMHDLLTKGIDENGQVRSEETHKFKDSPLGRIPHEWGIDEMQQITTRIVDGVHKTPTYTEDGIPFLTVENLTRGRGIDFQNVRFVAEHDHHEFSKRADPKKGDVLVSKDGTLGVPRIVPEDAPEFSIFVSVALIRPDTLRCLPEWVYYFFAGGSFENQMGALSAGSGLKHIHLEHFRKFQLPLPEIDEQIRITQAIDYLNSMYLNEERLLQKLQRQKTGLMQDLLRGTVSVEPFLEKEAGQVA